jgi:hypothetical protein
VSTSFRVILLYRYFAVCDWLTEPRIAETNALLARCTCPGRRSR